MIALDEPLASLDASAQAQLANLLTELTRELDVGLLLISHDLAIVRHVADVVSVMYLGKMVETGATRPLWEVPAHPYSEALVAAVPRPDGRGFLPESLEGEVPDPGRPPTRLPLPSPLSLRLRALPDRRAAAARARRRPARRVLAAARRRSRSAAGDARRDAWRRARTVDRVSGRGSTNTIR